MDEKLVGSVPVTVCRTVEKHHQHLFWLYARTAWQLMAAKFSFLVNKCKWLFLFHFDKCGLAITCKTLYLSYCYMSHSKLYIFNFTAKWSLYTFPRTQYFGMKLPSVTTDSSPTTVFIIFYLSFSKVFFTLQWYGCSYYNTMFYLQFYVS